ncbi:MAG: PAS domain S-box protein [Sphingobacteriales bacterium]|nr:MAG: PAS domain S-box protein [Sphingobacteriales bacterium]
MSQSAEQDKMLEILGSAPLAFYVLDKAWNFIYVNTQMEKLFRKTKDELIGNQYWEIFPTAVNEPIYTELNRAMETGLLVTFEEFNPVMNRWAEVTASPTKSGVAVFVHDISARKAEEQRLIEAKNGLQEFIDSAAVGIHCVNKDGVVIYVNKAELDLLGYTRDGYVGHHISEFYADQPVIDDIMKRLLTCEELHSYEARLKCKDGSIRHVLISSNVCLRDGEFQYTRCFTRDITKRRKAEQLLDLLNRAGEVLASTLDSDEGLEKMAELIVPGYADWLSINLKQDDEVKLIKLFHTDKERLDLAINYRKKVPFRLDRDKPNSLSSVSNTGETVLVTPVTNHDLEIIANDHDHLMALYRLQLKSYMIVPMMLHGEVIGAVNFMSSSVDKVFDESDVAFAKDLAGRIAFCIENSRRYNEAISLKA